MSDNNFYPGCIVPGDEPFTQTYIVHRKSRIGSIINWMFYDKRRLIRTYEDMSSIEKQNALDEIFHYLRDKARIKIMGFISFEDDPDFYYLGKARSDEIDKKKAITVTINKELFRFSSPREALATVSHEVLGHMDVLSIVEYNDWELIIEGDKREMIINGYKCAYANMKAHYKSEGPEYRSQPSEVDAGYAEDEMKQKYDAKKKEWEMRKRFNFKRAELEIKMRIDSYFRFIPGGNTYV